jgi:hypothetical protein
LSFEYSFHGKSKTALNNFFEFQNQELVDSFGAFFDNSFFEMFWFSSHFLDLDFSSISFLLLAKNPILLGLFSFAVEENTPFAVGLNQNEL